MNKIKRFILITLTGVFPVGVSSQDLRPVYSDSIPTSGLSNLMSEAYNEKMGFCGNSVYPEILTLAYLTAADDSFHINIYYLGRKKTDRKSSFRIANALVSDSFQTNINYSITRLYSLGNVLWIHYSKYLTRIEFNKKFTRIVSVKHIDIKQALNHSFRYFIPIGHKQEAFIGFQPNFLDSCPVKPENTIRPRILIRNESNFTLSGEYSELETFNNAFWPFTGYNPVQPNSEGIYVMNPLEQKLDYFDINTQNWKHVRLSGNDHLKNNQQCLDSIALAFDNNRWAMYYNCYPRNFYYKFLGQSGTSLFIFRNYREARDTSSYYIDEFKIIDSDSATLINSILLNNIPVTNSNGGLDNWEANSILMAPVFINEKFFCRIIRPSDYPEESGVKGQRSRYIYLEVFNK